MSMGSSPVADKERIAPEPLVEGDAHGAQARPCGPGGRPSLAAMVSATSASVARAPIGPGFAPRER